MWANSDICRSYRGKTGRRGGLPHLLTWIGLASIFSYKWLTSYSHKVENLMEGGPNKSGGVGKFFEKNLAGTLLREPRVLDESPLIPSELITCPVVHFFLLWSFLYIFQIFIYHESWCHELKVNINILNERFVRS